MGSHFENPTWTYRVDRRTKWRRKVPAIVSLRSARMKAKLAASFGSRCRISVCAPDEDFSRGTAMERNGFLYALSEAAIIVHARFKTGGTWHGAIEAQRRGLSKLIVRDDPANEAHLALAALGAARMRCPDDLQAALCACKSNPTQPAG